MAFRLILAAQWGALLAWVVGLYLSLAGTGPGYLDRQPQSLLVDLPGRLVPGNGKSALLPGLWAPGLRLAGLLLFLHQVIVATVLLVLAVTNRSRQLVA